MCYNNNELTFLKLFYMSVIFIKCSINICSIAGYLLEEFSLKRKEYFDYIEDKLHYLAYRIGGRDKLNLLDLNIHSETFFAELCNLIFDLKLTNINALKHNTEGIDLIDNTNKVVVQVSSTCSKAKINSSLSKDIFKQYSDYCFKFISISKDATDTLRNSLFKNPYNMNFSPKDDIWDCTSLLRIILAAGNEKQKRIYDLIKKELGPDIDYNKMESNLAKVITFLADVKLDENAVSPELDPFAIEDKIEFNNLQGVEETIDDYKIFYHKIDEIYVEFDKEGQNKSYSVLQEIRKQYISLKSSSKSSSEVFYGIINNLIDIIHNSRNYTEMPFEELEACVSILVVDAFIRCKIFKNPEGYVHVTTRQYTSGTKCIL